MYDDYDDYDDARTPEPTEPRDLVRHLRGVLKAQAEEAAELRSAHRELAFLKAGVNTTSPVGSRFFKVCDTPLSDMSSIQLEALELGCLRPPMVSLSDPVAPVTVDPVDSPAQPSVS